MAENYEFISAANLPTTDAKEVDVICVEGGELKRKPGASIGGGGGYVVRLPADTPMDGTGSSFIFMVEESYDNFADILYNGGSVLIDASATMLGQELSTGFAAVIPGAWSMQDGVLAAISMLYYSNQLIAIQFAFPNGTWTPPAE